MTLLNSALSVAVFMCGASVGLPAQVQERNDVAQRAVDPRQDLQMVDRALEAKSLHPDARNFFSDVMSYAQQVAPIAQQLAPVISQAMKHRQDQGRDLEAKSFHPDPRNFFSDVMGYAQQVAPIAQQLAPVVQGMMHHRQDEDPRNFAGMMFPPPHSPAGYMKRGDWDFLAGVPKGQPGNSGNFGKDFAWGIDKALPASLNTVKKIFSFL